MATFFLGGGGLVRNFLVVAALGFVVVFFGGFCRSDVFVVVLVVLAVVVFVVLFVVVFVLVYVVVFVVAIVVVAAAAHQTLVFVWVVLVSLCLLDLRYPKMPFPIISEVLPLFSPKTLSSKSLFFLSLLFILLFCLLLIISIFSSCYFSSSSAALSSSCRSSCFSSCSYHDYSSCSSVSSSWSSSSVF